MSSALVMLLLLKNTNELATATDVALTTVCVPRTVRLPTVRLPVIPTPPLTTRAPVPVEVELTPALA